MKIRSYLRLFDKKAFVVFSLLLCCTIVYLVCISASKPKRNGIFSSIPFNSRVPTDITNPADPQQAAEFAWKEFIALTWPAKVNPAPGPDLSGFYRGQPSATDSTGSTGANGTVVWETYYHRDELYPGYPYASLNGNVLPDSNAIPNYIYQGPVASAPGTNLHLFNNLDEASEIKIANMYYTPLSQQVDLLKKSAGGQPTPIQTAAILNAGIKSSLVYEAKGNPVIFKYLKSTGFNNPGPRGSAATQAINLVTNLPTRGAVFSLPNGSVEIKATWRRYDAAKDNLKEFHWAVGIYYTTNSKQQVMANNDTLLLVALHIIQKTPNVPTFTFATFEHVSNEKNGFRFTNVASRTDTMGVPRPLPDSGTITAIRQFAIPGASGKFNLVAYNHAIQNQMRVHFGNDVVWAHYQLIGVQAVPQGNPGGVVPAQQFFLSNFATETNNTLQFFQGGLAGPNSNVPNPNTAHVAVFNPAKKMYIGLTAGGCLGCHGSQGQFAGGDFSVIAATGNFFVPEAILPYKGGAVINQNPAGFPLPQKK